MCETDRFVSGALLLDDHGLAALRTYGREGGIGNVKMLLRHPETIGWPYCYLSQRPDWVSSPEVNRTPQEL
jgi:hypothetical protein